MEFKIIGIGSNQDLENSVGNNLIKAFESKDFNKVTILSAFASISAVKGINEVAKNNGIDDLTIITGIDQKGTSKEALEELLNSQAKAYIFYNPSNLIFHPKVYLFEGEDKIQFIVGSSNLTSQGLFQNIEASISVKLDKPADDLQPLESLIENFQTLFDLTDPNLQEISESIIEELFNLGIIPEEKERKKNFSKIYFEEKTNRDKVLEFFPKRKFPTVDKNFVRSSFYESISENEEETIGLEFSFNEEEEIVIWEKILSRRDINLPLSPSTNSTGSMLFTKGENKDLDQFHYFRNEVFSVLDWAPMEKKDNKEFANANFQLLINDRNCGFFNLTITHRTDSESETFKQANSVTDLRWGRSIDFIKDEQLLGKKLQLLKKGDSFIIKIN